MEYWYPDFVLYRTGEGNQMSTEPGVRSGSTQCRASSLVPWKRRQDQPVGLTSAVRQVNRAGGDSMRHSAYRCSVKRDISPGP